MWVHRLGGAALIALGAAVIGFEFVQLYGSADEYAIMVRIGLPGVALLTMAGLLSITLGLGLAAAPAQVVHHTRRAVGAVRKLGRRADATGG